MDSMFLKEILSLLFNFIGIESPLRSFFGLNEDVIHGGLMELDGGSRDDGSGKSSESHLVCLICN